MSVPWDLLGLGLVGLVGLLVTLFGRRQPTPPAPPTEVKTKAETKAVEDTKKAEDAHRQAVEDVSKERDLAIDVQVTELERKAPVFLEEPDELNAHLLDIGKTVRKNN